MISALKSLIRVRFFFTAVFLVVGGTIWLVTPRYTKYEGTAYGTYYRVIVFAPRVSFLKRSLHRGMEDVLDRVDAVFSSYRSDSNVMALNRHVSTDPIQVAPELYDVMSRSMAWFLTLDGAWDPTLAPLSQSLGLQPPSNGGLSTDRGFHHVTLQPNYFVKKGLPGLTFDFSSNAKGYAVDELMQFIQSHWVTGVYVDIGGDIRVAGHKDGQRLWRLGIQSPRLNEGPLTTMDVSDVAVATSGNYLNYVEKDGERVGHVLDPRHEGPLRHNLVSVTVMAPDCFTADTLATGLLVMGLDDARDWLAQHSEFSAILVTEESSGFVLHRL